MRAGHTPRALPVAAARALSLALLTAATACGLCAPGPPCIAGEPCRLECDDGICRVTPG